MPASRLEDQPPASGREGLPPSFRMRADAHYVDLITSRPAAPTVHLIAVKDIAAAQPAEESELGPLVESITSGGRRAAADCQAPERPVRTDRRSKAAGPPRSPPG